MLEKLQDPKEILKLLVTGGITLIVFALLSMIPPIFDFGFKVGDIALSLGILIRAGIGILAAGIVEEKLF